MSIRNQNGTISLSYKNSIKEQLKFLTKRVKKADKNYSNIADLTKKATELSKGKNKEERDKIRDQLKREIDIRKKERDNAYKAEDLFKKKTSDKLKSANVGFLISKSNNPFLFDLFTKEGRNNYIKNAKDAMEKNFLESGVKKIDTKLERLAQSIKDKRNRRILKQINIKKKTFTEVANGVKVDYIFDFEDFNNDPSLINQMVVNVRRVIDNTKYLHPNAKFQIRMSSEEDPNTDRYAFSLPRFENYTTNEALDILGDKLERALEEYDEEEDERFNFITISISFLIEPNIIMGSGGHKTLQMANDIWYIKGTTSKSNCFYRSIAFIRILEDLNNKVEEAEKLLGEDETLLINKINDRAKTIKNRLKDIENISRKTTTEDDIQKWVDKNYNGGGRGSNNKCEVVIYNSVFCKVKTIRPNGYTKGKLKTYEVWIINHHFIPLIRWSDISNIKEICLRKINIDKKKEEEKDNTNELIDKKIAYEIENMDDFYEWVKNTYDISEFKTKTEENKYIGWYKHTFKNDTNKVRRQINPMINKIATYDFEATPNGNNNVFITYRASISYNVLDEEDNFIKIETKTFGGKGCIEKLMMWLYHNRKMLSGYTLYAHNAGKFDLLLILGEYLLQNDNYWKIDTESLIVLNGAYLNLIIFNEDEEGTYTLGLRDSYRLLPASLDKLCKEFNVEHKKLSGSVDFNEMNISNCFGGYVKDKKVFSSDLFRLELGNYVYCNWDTIGLLEVMNKFKNEVYENMGGINITNCLTGASLSKKNYFLSYYDSKSMPIYSMCEEFDTFCRNGYYGGRNEAFYIGEYNKKLYYNDFTSLYPDVGRNRLPYGKPSRIPKEQIDRWNYRYKNKKCNNPLLGIVKVLAKTKNKDLLPLHAIKKDSKLLFPIFEKPTEIYLWYNELLYGMSLDQYEYELLDGIIFGEPRKGIKKSEKETFWKNGVLSNFFNDAFEKKGKAKAEGKLALAQCYKIVANSGYGFWGLNARGDNNEGRDGMEILKTDDSSFWELLDKGFVSNANKVGKYTLVRTSKPMPIKDFNVAIATAICSEARIKIHKFMSAIKKVGNILYCDTDSCISDVDMTKYPNIMSEFCWDGNGDDLGSMKNEAVEKLEKYFNDKVMKENPLLDEVLDKPIIKKKVKEHMKKQLELDKGDYYFDKGIIAGCKQYCLHKTTYDGGHIEASASKGVCRKLNYSDFHHLLYGSKMEEQKQYEELIKKEKPDWIAPEGFRLYERQFQFRSSLISHIEGDMEIVKTPVDKAMRINYLKGLCQGSKLIDGVNNKGFVSPLIIP